MRRWGAASFAGLAPTPAQPGGKVTAVTGGGEKLTGHGRRSTPAISHEDCPAGAFRTSSLRPSIRSTGGLSTT